VRAAVLHEVGRPIRLEEIARPVPKAGEVLVQVVATGVCHTDLHVVKGEVAFPKPCVLGHEMSGIVAGLGDGVGSVAVGDRVVSPFIMPCGTCAFCARGEEDLCATFFAENRLKGTLYDGTSRLAFDDGRPIAMYSMAGFAEYSVVPATAVFRVPDEVDLAPAAVIGCALFTAFGLLRHAAALRAGETVAVVGTGGVGSAAIQLAHVFGASRIIAVDIREDKLAAARAVGATDVVNAAESDVGEAVRALTGGEGVDVALEAFGHPATFASALGAVRDGGRVALAGIAPAGVEASFEITRLVRRKIQVLGSYGGRARSDMPQLLALARAGRIDPGRFVTRRYRLDETAEAFAALDRGDIVGRAIVVADEVA
jgi:succinate semialdehyde reductase (NADPH)